MQQEIIIVMDFLKYYDNIVHDKALKAFSRVLLDDELEFLKISFREFEIDVSYMTDYEFKSNQQCTALLRQLRLDGKVTRVEDKKGTLYFLADGEEA